MNNKNLCVAISVLALWFYTLDLIFDSTISKILLGTMLIVGFVLIIRLNARSKIYDGEMVVGKTEGGGKLLSLELNGDPEELENKDVISFKVVQPSE